MRCIVEYRRDGNEAGGGCQYNFVYMLADLERAVVRVTLNRIQVYTLYR